MNEILYDWGGANTWGFHLINNLRHPVLDQLMLIGTWLGGHANFPFYLGLLAIFVLVRASRPVSDPRAYELQLQRCVAVIAVFSLSYWLDGLFLGYLKPILDFPRPLLALPFGTVNVVGLPEYHHSLPSGHSSFAMMMIASLWPLLNRRWRIAGGIFVAWVGISRVSLGAHFPADVLAGYISSLLIVLLISFCIRKLLLPRLTRQSGN